MNQRKESILNDNINNFIDALKSLDNAYTTRSEIKIYKYPCIVERYATRLYTQFENWTTCNNDIKYKDMINRRLQYSTTYLNNNLIQFIKEQSDIEGMLYYTYELLHSAKLL